MQPGSRVSLALVRFGYVDCRSSCSVAWWEQPLRAQALRDGACAHQVTLVVPVTVDPVKQLLSLFGLGAQRPGQVAVVNPLLFEKLAHDLERMIDVKVLLR